MEQCTVLKRLFNSRKRRLAALLIVFSVLTAGAAWLYFHNPYTTYPLPCAFYVATGLYCPGCGAGRASYFLLHGRWQAALSHNMAAVILFPFLFLFLLCQAIRWVWTGEVSEDRPWLVRMLRIVLFGLVLYGVARNLPWYPFTLLAPGIR